MSAVTKMDLIDAKGSWHESCRKEGPLGLKRGARVVRTQIFCSTLLRLWLSYSSFFLSFSSGATGFENRQGKAKGGKNLGVRM